jgi:hypothetical protein
MITKIINASRYNVDGSTAFKYGSKVGYYDRFNNPSYGSNFNPTGSVLAQDSFFKSFAVNGTATTTRTRFFSNLSHGSCLGDISIYNGGTASLLIFINNAPTGFSLDANAVYSAAGNISEIDLATLSGTASFHLIGLPPRDSTKVLT